MTCSLRTATDRFKQNYSIDVYLDLKKKLFLISPDISDIFP